MATEQTPGRPRRSSRALAATAFGLACASVACTHDFDAFEPVGGDSEGGAGTVLPSHDASAGVDAEGPGDSSPSTLPEAAPLSDGSTCGADCRIEAISCAGTCAQIEQSCAASCASGDSACTQGCQASDTSCASQCVTVCETCTSTAGCIDPAGCAKAAP